MAKFVKHVLPDILVEMQQEYGWSRTPRTVVHDKASYFVASRAQRLATSFADALRGARLKSWLGDADADCNWLAARLGDVYPHETVISHIRRSLDHRFPRCSPGETRSRFANRMQKVQAYMNSEEFVARDGAGLASLAEMARVSPRWRSPSVTVAAVWSYSKARGFGADGPCRLGCLPHNGGPMSCYAGLPGNVVQGW